MFPRRITHRIRVIDSHGGEPTRAVLEAVPISAAAR